MEVSLLEEVKTFLQTLEEKTFAKALRMIDLLEEFGINLRMPHSKPMGRGLHELRVRGSQEVRLIYAFRGNTAVIVYAFSKKSQRIPQREFEYAFKLLKGLDAS